MNTQTIRLIFLAAASLLLASCGSPPNQTTDPAASSRMAVIEHNTDGSMHVRGATCRLSAKDGIAKGGLQADIENGKVVRYYFKSVRILTGIPADEKIIGTVAFKNFNRMELEKISRGTAGLSVSFVDYIQPYVLSPAYVLSFLQKVDEALRKPQQESRG